MGNLALCNIAWHDGFQTSSALGPLWKANFLVLLPMLLLALCFSNHGEAIKHSKDTESQNKEFKMKPPYACTKVWFFLPGRRSKQSDDTGSKFYATCRPSRICHRSFLIFLRRT